MHLHLLFLFSHLEGEVGDMELTDLATQTDLNWTVLGKDHEKGRSPADLPRMSTLRFR